MLDRYTLLNDYIPLCHRDLPILVWGLLVPGSMSRRKDRLHFLRLPLGLDTSEDPRYSAGDELVYHMAGMSSGYLRGGLVF